MSDDLRAPIHAICPGCGEPSQDLLGHALHCSAPEALDFWAGLQEDSLETTAAIEEIEFALTVLPAEERADYVSRLAELQDELNRLNARNTAHRRLLEVLRERRLLLDG